MGDFGADTLRDSIESAWALTGRLLKVGSETDTMKETVQFFAHPQVIAAGEYTKAVEVKKVNTDEKENVVTHPRFFEHHDNYEIMCRYRVVGGDETLYDIAEQDVEDMTEEVERIVKTVYDPSAGTGVFWTTTRTWSIEDALGSDSRFELKRTLHLQLTRIKSRSSEVFQGYGGVLSFDVSASVADSKPAGDYIYTEAFNVSLQEGFRQEAEMTTDTTHGLAVPVHFTGQFSGRFSCQIYAKSSDLDATPDDATKLDNIYKIQASSPLTGETPEIVFLHATTDTGVTTLTTSTTVKITSITKSVDDENLVTLNLVGDVIRPTVWSVA